MLNFFRNLSPVEIGVIALILILLFGPKLVKNLGRLSGETVKEMKNVKKSINEAVDVGDKKEVSN